MANKTYEFAILANEMTLKTIIFFVKEQKNVPRRDSQLKKQRNLKIINLFFLEFIKVGTEFALIYGQIQQIRREGLQKGNRSLPERIIV